jgi:hypothetical protein
VAFIEENGMWFKELKLPIMKKVTEIFHGFFGWKYGKNILKNITKGKYVYKLSAPEITPK